MKLLRDTRPTGRVDARITLRKGLWENGSAVFADIRDPKSCIPIPLHLTLVTEIGHCLH